MKLELALITNRAVSEEAERVMEDIPYRAFILDEQGHIRAAEILNAEDDETAKTEARKFVDGHDVEVWHGARFVIRFPEK